MGFRPLYRGLFSITSPSARIRAETTIVFVPFIGDFFQSADYHMRDEWGDPEFSSPLSGTFFNQAGNETTTMVVIRFRPLYRGLFSITKREKSIFFGPVFVPFIGDFFQS